MTLKSIVFKKYIDLCFNLHFGVFCLLFNYSQYLQVAYHIIFVQEIRPIGFKVMTNFRYQLKSV